MELLPIVSPDGLPMFAAGGRHAWKTFEHRGYVVSLEWTRRRRRTVPTMVIWPAGSVLRSRGSESNGMWVITRDSVYHFVGFNKNDKCTGSGTPDLYREAQEALTILGHDRNDKHALNALIDTVIKYAGELVVMPPAPLSIKRELQYGFTRGPIWEVTASQKSSGKVITEGEA